MKLIFLSFFFALNGCLFFDSSPTLRENNNQPILDSGTQDRGPLKDDVEGPISIDGGYVDSGSKLKVLRTRPENLQTNAKPNKPIEIVFNQEVVVNAENITLKKGANEVLFGLVRKEGNKWWIMPKNPIKPLEKYTVVLSNIEGLQTFTFSFTADFQWRPSESIGDGKSPYVAMGGGIIAAIWESSSAGGTHNLIEATFDGKNWNSSAIKVQAEDFVVGIDGAGQKTIAYRDGEKIIAITSSSANEEEVGNSNSGDADLGIAVNRNGSGNPALVWKRGNKLRIAKKSDDGWVDEKISDQGSRPHISMAADKAVASWQEGKKFYSFFFTQTSEKKYEIDNKKDLKFSNGVIDDQGNIRAFTSIMEADTMKILTHYLKYSGTPNWVSESKNLEASSSVEPQIVMNGHGDAFLVYLSKNERSIMVERYEGKSFEALYRLPIKTKAKNLQVVIDEGGRALITWIENGHLWATRYQMKTFNKHENRNRDDLRVHKIGGSGMVSQYHVAMDYHLGRATVVWSENGKVWSTFFK